jgi:hypothetical protein
MLQLFLKMALRSEPVTFAPRAVERMMEMNVPPESQLREKLEEVLARPEFQHGPPGEPDLGALKWLMIVIRWLSAPIRWLFEMTEGLPEFLRWIIVGGLLIALTGLMIHLGWTFFRVMRGGPALTRKSRLTWGTDQQTLTVIQLENEATRNAESGAFIEAVRLLFRAMLMRLEEREGRRFRRGTTNRQHLRRYADSPIADSLSVLVQVIEQKWFGEGACVRADFETCQDAYSRIRTWLTPKNRVVEKGTC